jgi:hypothetical protein
MAFVAALSTQLVVDRFLDGFESGLPASIQATP